jgi:uncharacterized peroxidase-related enzyme
MDLAYTGLSPSVEDRTFGSSAVRPPSQEEKPMSRIPTPATIEAAPAAARGVLQAVKSQLGVVPNMFRLISNSPAALKGYVELNGALNRGALPAATRERIALAVAEENRCDYCLSAHTYLGKRFAKLDEAEIAANRRGASSDPKADAAVRFAAKLVRERGHVGEDDLRALKAAGYDDAQAVEIVLHVALNTWTNYMNLVGATDIDFPVVSAGTFN